MKGLLCTLIEHQFRQTSLEVIHECFLAYLPLWAACTVLCCGPHPHNIQTTCTALRVLHGPQVKNHCTKLTVERWVEFLVCQTLGQRGLGHTIDYKARSCVLTSESSIFLSVHMVTNFKNKSFSLYSLNLIGKAGKMNGSPCDSSTEFHIEETMIQCTWNVLNIWFGSCVLLSVADVAKLLMLCV